MSIARTLVRPAATADDRGRWRGRGRRGGLIAILAFAAAGCPGKAGPAAVGPGGPNGAGGPRVTALPPTTIKVGDCGVPERDGVVSAAPRLVHADRDLDGDGAPEPVVADQVMCSGDRNCYWNVFLPAADGGCARFAGALAGAYLEPHAPGPGGVPAPVRAYWNLGGPRLLVQDYEFRRGGYVLVDTLLCRREDDDRLRCTEDDR